MTPKQNLSKRTKISIPKHWVERFQTKEPYPPSTLPARITKDQWKDWGRWVRTYQAFCRNHRSFFAQGHPVCLPQTEATSIRAFLKLLHPQTPCRPEVEPFNKLIWIDHLMRWYFQNFRKPFVPLCGTLPTFVRKFSLLEKAYFRQKDQNPMPPALVYESWRLEMEREDPVSYSWFLEGGPMLFWQELGLR